MSRIPLELQAIFVASNKGEEVHKPPSNRAAFKVFKSIFGGFGRRKRSTENKRENLKRIASQSSFATVSTLGVDDFSGSSHNENNECAPVTPHEHLEVLLKARGYCTERYSVLQTAFFNRPTPLQLASYDTKLIQLIKSQDEQKVREILASGISPNACNIHGESLIHKACRLGYHRLVRAFTDFGADLAISDAQGRTLLHDTCWGARPSFQTFSLIVDRQPELLFLADCRGACPLEYVRKDHYVFWIEYLDQIADKYWPSTQSTPKLSYLVKQEPHSRQIGEPGNALSLELAAMVASGRLSPEEATYLAKGDEEDSVSDEEDSLSDDDESTWNEEDNEDDELLADLCGIHSLSGIPV